MKNFNTRRRQQRGFTIIEALIALAIMGFGILGLAGLQAALSRNADVAKQRTEAMRLAQEKIEEYRSFTGFASTAVAASQSVPASNTGLNWNALKASDSDVPSNNYKTNAEYKRSWSLSGTEADAMRSLTVNVEWLDRTGEKSNVSLTSIIAKSNPADAGFLGFPLPLNTNLKRPKNRNLDIPIPSVDLGDGKSAVKFQDNGKFLLFDNITGDVAEICTPNFTSAINNATIISTLTDANNRNCTAVKGYILAGYVSRLKGNNVTGALSDAEWNAIENGLGIDYSLVNRDPATSAQISCQFGNAINQNDNTVIANYKYYICLIPWAATDSSPYTWSGTIRISGPTAWNNVGNVYYVCRYQYTKPADDPNMRNVQPYAAVNKSIDQQNYLIAATANATSSATPTCPATMTVTDVSVGVLHQDCRSASNANHANASDPKACPLKP